MTLYIALCLYVNAWTTDFEGIFEKLNRQVNGEWKNCTNDEHIQSILIEAIKTHADISEYGRFITVFNIDLNKFFQLQNHFKHR